MIVKKYSSFARSFNLYWSRLTNFALIPLFFAVAAKFVASFLLLPVSVPYAMVILLTAGFAVGGSLAGSVPADKMPDKYPFIQISSSLVEDAIRSCKIFSFEAGNMVLNLFNAYLLKTKINFL